MSEIMPENPKVRGKSKKTCERENQRFLTDAVPEALRVVVALMNDHEVKNELRFNCAKEILNRAGISFSGNPVQDTAAEAGSRLEIVFVGDNEDCAD